MAIDRNALKNMPYNNGANSGRLFRCAPKPAGYAERSQKGEKLDLPDRVLEMLLGRVFHVTSSASWLNIQAAGFIETNERARHETPFGVPSSYGRRKGYVCLFDLRGKSDEDIKEGHLRLPFTRPHQLGAVAVYLLIAPLAFPNIIDEEAAIQDAGSRDWIPGIECWYPSPVSVDLIESAVTVDFELETISTKAANAKMQRSR